MDIYLEDESGRVMLKFSKDLEDKIKLVTGVVAAFYGCKIDSQCMEIDRVQFPQTSIVKNEIRPQSCSKLFFLSFSLENDLNAEIYLSIFKECLKGVIS